MTGTGPHVLVVEDNPDHAELVMTAIEDVMPTGRVDHVADGAAALEYLHQQTRRASGNLPELVLLDLRLPKIDGLQVLRSIKEHEALRIIPVIVLTTSDAVDDMYKAYHGYANSYIVKPLGYEALQAIVRQLLDYWSDCNRLPV